MYLPSFNNLIFLFVQRPSEGLPRLVGGADGRECPLRPLGTGLRHGPHLGDGSPPRHAVRESHFLVASEMMMSPEEQHTRTIESDVRMIRFLTVKMTMMMIQGVIE